MKKIIYIVLLLTFFNSFSQIDVKDTRKQAVYINGVFVSNHNNDANSLEKLINSLRLNPLDTVEILTHGKITATLSKDFFTIKGSQNLITFRDTTTHGIIANVINEGGKKRYGYFYTKDTINKIGNYIKVLPLDSVYVSNCVDCKNIPKNEPLNLRVRYEGKYPVEYKEYLDTTFQVKFNLIISQDSLSTRTQTYANDVWSFYKRSSSTLDSIYKKKFIFYSDSPGDGIGDPGTESYTGDVLRRHSSYHYFKYFQIMAVRNEDGYCVILDIQENTKM